MGNAWSAAVKLSRRERISPATPPAFRKVAAAHATLLAFLAFGLCLDAGAQDFKVIHGATVIDGKGGAPIRDGVIVIEGSRIREVGTGTSVTIPMGSEIIEGKGKFVIPGLADMHNHLGRGDLASAPQSVKANMAFMLALGFTTIFNPASSPAEYDEARKLTAQDDSPYPRFYGVKYFTAKGGYGFTPGAYRPETVEQARAMVKEAKSFNPDALKIAYDDLGRSLPKPLPMLSRELLEAIIDEGHKQGLKSYAHVTSLPYAKEYLRAGGDGLVHSASTGPVDDEFFGLMKKNGALYIPTLALFEAMADFTGWAKRLQEMDVRGVVPKEIHDVMTDPATAKRVEARFGPTTYAFMRQQIQTIRSNTKKVFDAGIPVVMGTDTGVPGVQLGLSSQMELVLYVESGLTPLQALQTATINAARVFGKDKELGTIEPGKLADLVILDADPLADMKNIRMVNRVIKGGVIFDPVKLLETAKVR